MGAKKEQEDLIDAGSELSFPASDPPSYMGGSAVAGPPPQKEPAREPVTKAVSNPEEVKPVCDAPEGTDPARAGDASKRPSGSDNP